MEKEAEIGRIRNEVLQLTTSPLYEYRIVNKSFPVIGEGSLDAKIVFVGEAPGKNEALTGKPFCGASGRILDQLLASIALPREEVYITNIVKDRPPENRDPTEDEIALYGPFLDHQIEIIKPKVIATLGRYSMAYIMTKFGKAAELGPISKIHGNPFEVLTSFGSLHIMPLYHPAVVVYNSVSIEVMKADFEKLKRLI